MNEQEKKVIQNQGENKNVKEEVVIQPIIEKAEKRMSFLEVLSKLSPGKSIRTALDDILHASDGALIVIDCPGLKNIFEGGFRVNCKFTPQKLAELAKMDGAIILSKDLKKILFANALLVPNTRIPSNETGTRHMAAERTSMQKDTPVIAVSERRNRVSLFYDHRKYIIQDSEILLRRATETLHLLEKQREIADELLTNLNVLETTNLVSVGDVCSVLQRIEIIIKMMDKMKRHLIELGREGMLLQARIRELFKGIEPLEVSILKDYVERPFNVKRFFSNISFDGLLNTESLAGFIFDSSQDKQIVPKGYRILDKLNLTERETKHLIEHFQNLTNILDATDEDLKGILKNKTESFMKELESIKEQIMLGKRI